MAKTGYTRYERGGQMTAEKKKTIVTALSAVLGAGLGIGLSYVLGGLGSS